ncbi:chaperonin-containing T-complex member BBS12 [Scleropages formosus]|nr:Bardet-Biedl syndrome 12 protein [Scleropages formosus]
MPWGCGAVGGEQHAGLQQLIALAAATKSFLGPNKSYKFVDDQAGHGGSFLVCSPSRLLEHLELSCPVSQLLLETVQAHQKAFCTGAGTLIFLAGAWSLAALECLRDGIPVCDIVSALTEGLDSCTEACRMSCVTVAEAIRSYGSLKSRQANRAHGDATSVKVSSQSATGSDVFHSSSAHLPGQAASRCGSLRPDQEHKALASLRHRARLRHSRYFNEKEESTGAESGSERSPRCESSSSHLCDLGSEDVAFLGSTVSHGSENLMNLVIEASRIQRENSEGRLLGGTVFDVSKLATCLVEGLWEEHSCVTSGLVTFVSVDQASLIQGLTNQSLRVAIFDGDLSEKYRHLGFRKPSGVRRVAEVSNAPRPLREGGWLERVLDTLLQLEVNLLLVNGVVCTHLAELCLRRGIAFVERVESGVLQHLAEATGAVPLTYVTQMSEHCVGEGALVAIWREGIGDGRRVAVNIRAGRSALVTAVITSTVQSKLRSLEDRFWGCAHRLHHSLRDGKLLRGGGEVELDCIRHLRGLLRDGPSTGACGQNRSAVLQRMSHGWMDYIATLLWNSGECSSKLEAWDACSRAAEQQVPGSTLPTVISNLHPQLNADWLEGGRGGRSATPVYDNMTVKLEAWRRALDLVLIVLQTDMEIIAGSSHRDTEGLPAHFIIL